MSRLFSRVGRKRVRTFVPCEFSLWLLAVSWGHDTPRAVGRSSAAICWVGTFPSSPRAYCISFLLSGPSAPLQRTWSQLVKYQTVPASIQARQAPTYYWELPVEGQGGLGATTEICEASALSLTASRSECFLVVHLISFCMSCSWSMCDAIHSRGQKQLWKHASERGEAC